MAALIVSRVAESLGRRSIRSVSDALDEVRSEYGAARVSLALLGEHSVEMMSSVGRPLLANGVQVPRDSSSLFLAAARGSAFRDADLPGSAEFDRPVDRLMLASGFQSAWAVPVRRDRRVAGVLSISHIRRYDVTDRILDELDSLSALFSLSLEYPQACRPARILVCHDSPLAGQGIARILERALAAEVVVAATPESLRAVDRSSMSS